MLPSWFWLAFFAGLASNLSNFVGRKALMGGQDSTAFSWWFAVLRITIFGFLALFDYHLKFSWYNLGILVSFGLIEVVAIYLFTKMHSLTELSISSIVTRLRIVWLPLVAWILMGEVLLGIEYVGIGLLFLGLFLTVSPKKIKSDEGIRIALTFSMVSAILSTLMKMSTQIVSTPMVMVFMSLPTAIILPLLMKNPRKRLVNSWRLRIKENLVFSIFSGVAMFLLALALKLGSASKVVGIYQGMMITAVIMGIVFLNEKDNIARKIIGALVVVGGVLLLV